MDMQERDQLIAKLLGDGVSLSDVQKTLEREHDIRMTYMDLRLLVSGLEVDYKKLDADKQPADDADAEDEAGDVIQAEATVEGGPGTTHVTVSKIVRPGSVMSGDVTFASGKTAEWFLDQLGRLGLNPTNGSEKPSQEDLEDFQAELQRVMQNGGM